MRSNLRKWRELWSALPNSGWPVSAAMRFLKYPPKWFVVCSGVFGLFVVARAVYLIGFGSAEEVNKFIVGVAAFAGAPFLIWRTWIADRQRHLSQEELYTSLLTKAVEQLGSTREEKTEDGKVKTIPNIEVRLGAIYALEKLARDYLPLHWEIMEILCAYVRTNAGPPKVLPEHLDALIQKVGNSWTPSETEVWSKHWSGLKPFVDIQAALAVIGRRAENQKNYEEKLTQSQERQERVLDLSNCHLARVHLRGMYFRKANFDGSYLESADFEGTDLRDASFVEAKLSRARFCRALLDGAVLSEAHLSGASLQNASLEHAFLVGATIERASLVEANLKCAVLDGVSFVGSSLDLANMEETLVECADFTGATGLSQEQLNKAFGDVHTILPDKLTRPARWFENYDGEHSLGENS